MLEALVLLAVAVTTGLLWLGNQLKLQARDAGQLRLQVAQAEQRLAHMSQLVRDQATQGSQQLKNQQQLNARLIEIESRGDTAQGVRAARDRLKQGQNLRSLVQQGTLNQSEAHLISLLHRGRKRSSH
ncbi:MAG: hypothetical protein AAGA23_10840 [Pseudomonadota bacterium]